MKELGSLRFLLQVRFIATNFCTYYEKNINDRSTPELPEKPTTPRFFFTVVWWVAQTCPLSYKRL